MHRLAICYLTLFATVTVAQAAEPENYIKYRQAMMKAIGGHMGASTQILRGRVPEQQDLVMHARALADLSKDLTRVFPEGSDFGETQAKIEIWDNWDDFKAAANQARDATAAFAEAAATGDMAKAAQAQRKVGESCKGCHEDFRRKDD